MSRRVRSFSDVKVITSNAKNRILTLFSGGVDSSYLLQHIRHFNTDIEIYALTIDLGDVINKSEIQAITNKFRAQCIIVDETINFANDYVIPAIRAQARYLGNFPVSASLSRPAIAKTAVRIAEQYGCNTILHTANQSQNSLRRLNGAIKDLGFPGYYGSPYQYDAINRHEKINSLMESGLRHFFHRSISGDSNLWVREFESGLLDDPEFFEIPEDLYVWTARKPMSGSRVCVEFFEGIPVSFNNNYFEINKLIYELNHYAGSFGIGRYAGLEHLEGGQKVLEVRECPAAHILLDAYRHLETSIFDAEFLREKISIEQIWTREAVEGRWFGQLKKAADAFILTGAERITGTVTYNLSNGYAELMGINAKNAIYIKDREDWETSTARLDFSRSLLDVEVA